MASNVYVEVGDDDNAKKTKRHMSRRRLVKYRQMITDFKDSPAMFDKYVQETRRFWVYV
jgi:hypothetical protein